MRGIINRAVAEPQRVVFPEGEEPEDPARRADPGRRGHRRADPARRRRDDHAVAGRRRDRRSTASSSRIRGASRAPRRVRRRTSGSGASGRGMTQARGAASGSATPNYFGSVMVALGDADALVVGRQPALPRDDPPGARGHRRAPEGRARQRHLHAGVREARRSSAPTRTVNIEPDRRAARGDRHSAGRHASRPSASSRASRCCRSRTSARCKHPEPQQGAPRRCSCCTQRDPALMVDGEMQADTALDEDDPDARRIPSARSTSAANVLIFPNLSAGNIAYKLLHHLGGATAIGPILVGMAPPGARAAARCRRAGHRQHGGGRRRGRAGTRTRPAASAPSALDVDVRLHVLDHVRTDQTAAGSAPAPESPTPLEQQGLAPERDGPLEPRSPPSSSRPPSAAARASSPTWARSSPSPRPHTGRSPNDKFVVRGARHRGATWTGARSTSRIDRGALRRAARRRARRT